MKKIIWQVDNWGRDVKGVNYKVNNKYNCIGMITKATISNSLSKMKQTCEVSEQF